MKSPFVLLQYILPHKLLTGLVGQLARRRVPVLTPLLIRLFIRAYHVNMQEAEQPDPAAYHTFNDFFTRRLRADARPLNQLGHWSADTLICPVDGAVSQAGPLAGGDPVQSGNAREPGENVTLIQAKSHRYRLSELLGPDIDTAPYANGQFATLYLSPRDYHRIHMPVTGRLTRMTYVPGRLFSVNNTTAEQVPNLFARNERLVCEFRTEQGPLAIVLVGAMIVGRIVTTWAGPIARQRKPRTWDYGEREGPELHRGDELGQFELGSTVILVSPGRVQDWTRGLTPGLKVRVGDTFH